MFKKDTPSLIIEVLTARIKEWYNGYHVQNKQGDKHSFYNPYDVMSKKFVGGNLSGLKLHLINL